MAEPGQQRKAQSNKSKQEKSNKQHKLQLSEGLWNISCLVVKDRKRDDTIIQYDEAGLDSKFHDQVGKTARDTVKQQRLGQSQHRIRKDIQDKAAD